MNYPNEVKFLIATLKKCNLQTLILNPFEPIDNADNDFTLFSLSDDIDKGKTFISFFPDLKPNTLYKLSDSFFCKYIFLLLDNTKNPSVLLIGPYTSNDYSIDEIYHIASRLNSSAVNLKDIEHIYSRIPLITEENHILAMLDTLCEKLWGENNFSVVDINKDDALAFFKIDNISQNKTVEENMINMKLLEERYAFENELLDAVTHGKLHKAELMFTGFSSLAFENRLSDSLRNIKNYCIIMNTLLRKAAEKGGVHPVYLDNISSDFAKKIEALPSTSKAPDFMLEIFRSYCKLVRNRSINRYSPLVQKAIALIDSDLTADLSLKALAEINNVSSGYFSTLFKKETGKTLTEFVNSRRIEYSKKLLKTTQLQIQTIAQNCGILDVHYFTKLFKKSVGMTPKEYREK
ncbi:MAG: AraC family transcriptional regulator [Ruminococcaceae bacterium]|nr:AraC family transcriptional regulator [Oscillospiraceae bacterium]